MAVPTTTTDDNGSFSTSATAAENTPLLLSETASSYTARDVVSLGHQPVVEDEERISRARGVCIILSMWALIFLQASNMSGISTTQSIIAADLNAYEHAMWFTSSYLITMSSVAPLVGRLSMIFTPGVMTLFSSFFFSVGALVTSQAHTFAVFILGRILVGIGGGGIMTLSMILVIQLTSRKRRGLWIGVNNAGFTIGLSTGAVVYGALLPALGWRALFWIQSPIGVLAGLGVYLSMPASLLHGTSSPKDPSPVASLRAKLATIDYAGALALTLTITLFLYSLSGTIQPLPLLLSLLTLSVFLLIESRHATDPIIPLHLLADRGILLSCLSQFGFMAARWTVLFYAPVFILAVRGLSPAVAGAVLLPTNLGFGTGGLLVGWLHVRHAGAFWLPSLVSLALFTVALAGLSFLSTAAASAALYVSVIFLNGLFTGAALNYTLAHLLHLSSPDMHFIVTGLLSTFRGFAGSFGTAIGGGVFARSLRGALADGFARLDGGNAGGGVSRAREKMITVLIGSPAEVWDRDFLSPAERAIAVAGYEGALRVLYRSAAGVCLLVLLLQAGTGWAAPPATEAEEEEIEEAFADADATMEA
ncbi:major facilitator superfamily domain-containing protein [Podospora appendiculata]|uniref:Major facilitator superfamily domain-containing protein n=1 Tax=Podospora appendiculata TaxID=314037 RepID=A0AAE0WZD4_9PEZI|nr:major facilitator superfamily domain-containing protein [Podospora appendiculata]